MRPLKRGMVHKRKSANRFKSNIRRTKGANLQVQRGGIRF